MTTFVVEDGLSLSDSLRIINQRGSIFILGNWGELIKDADFRAKHGSTPIRGGVLRVIRVLEKAIKPAFLSEPEKVDIELTLLGIKEMNHYETNSGANLYIPGVYMPNWFRKVSEQGAGLLTNS